MLCIFSPNSQTFRINLSIDCWKGWLYVASVAAKRKIFHNFTFIKKSLENLLVLLDFYDGLFKVYACQCGNFLLKFNLLFWHLSALPANDLPFVFMLSILMNGKWLACFFSKITKTQKRSRGWTYLAWAPTSAIEHNWIVSSHGSNSYSASVLDKNRYSNWSSKLNSLYSVIQTMDECAGRAKCLSTSPHEWHLSCAIQLIAKNQCVVLRAIKLKFKFFLYFHEHRKHIITHLHVIWLICFFYHAQHLYLLERLLLLHLLNDSTWPVVNKIVNLPAERALFSSICYV